VTAPLWLTAARKKIGTREVVGRLHNATIVGWLRTLGAWWFEDETPWCGTFVAACLKEAGLPYAIAWYRALAWQDYGLRLRTDRLSPGAILVFGRSGGGHVGFYLGETATAYRVLGGNQSNRVCEAWIAKDRLVAARWPRGEPVIYGPLMLTDNAEPVSKNEA
jgi:uncharacterized protein (TIGR02594 family)